MESTLSPDTKVRLRRQLIFFFVLTLGLSWSIFGTALSLGFADSPIVILGIWGPSLTAVILTVWFYKVDGLKRFFSRFQFKRGLRWFLPLLVFFLAVGVVGKFLGATVAGIDVDIEFWGWAWVAQVLIIQLIVPGIGEELGWRGFALQRLQQLTTPLKATLVVALFHILWHAPTYWLGQGMHNVPAIWVVVFIVPWTILFTWAYNRSDGSLAVSILFHATMGATLSYTAFLPSEQVVPITPDLITMLWLPDGLMAPYLGVAALYWVLALYVLRGGFGGLGAPPEFEHPLN